MAENKTPVIIIFAPTACGKTALTRKIFGKSSLSCFKGRGFVVSADSQAVYKGFDIGTAKPSLKEQEDLPHYLIDIASPFEQFGLGQWMAEAEKCVSQIWKDGKFPLIVGGTAFYIRNFILGMPKTPESSAQIREMVQKKLQALGKEALYAELEIIDPLTAKKISVNDEYRICRALEVFYSSGKPLSSFKMPAESRECYDFCTIILKRPKEELYERISKRVDLMFEEGLEQEVNNLIKGGCTKDSPAMKGIGYSEFFEDYNNIEELKQKIKNDSCHYAKKQYTLMKGIPGAVTVNAEDYEKMIEILSVFSAKWT